MSSQKIALRNILGLLMLLGCVVMLGHVPEAQAARVTSVQNMTTDSENSLMPHVAQDPDGNLHVVWDTNVGSRQVAYRKGVWNGSGYTFGPTAILADVGRFGYSTPAIAIAPNGTLLVAWSDQFQVFIRIWNSRDAQPSGSTAEIMPGFDANIAVDNANRFHIVANGDFHIQYCEWNNGCSRRDAFGRNRNADPDVAVDSNGGVHVVSWGGGTINYFNRPAGGDWNEVALANGGNVAQIAADGQGNVYIVWSQDYNIQFCRLVNGTCTEQQTFDAAGDLSPSISATQAGDLVVAFYDKDDKRLWFVTREKGAWSGPQDVGGGPTGPDLTIRPYTNRISAVWSLDYDIYLATTIVAEAAPPPAPQPPAPQPPAPQPPAPQPPAPQPPTAGNFDFASNSFRNLWSRSDSLVAQQAVNYSWIWGPAPFTPAVGEYYVQSPGQIRTVQYFDKSRMEINQPDAPQGPFYVTNGRLTDELITGQLQVGDAQYEQRAPSAISVAGDRENTFPLYRDLQAIYRRTRSAEFANEQISRAADGSVRIDVQANTNNNPSMRIVQRVDGVGIPRVFWDFMNQSGRVVENGRVVTANPLFNWRYVTGVPLTEAYWTVVKVGGREQNVLVQAFERRVLTFTPANPSRFQVEMGNIGRHYFEWRYGVAPR